MKGNSYGTLLKGVPIRPEVVERRRGKKRSAETKAKLSASATQQHIRQNAAKADAKLLAELIVRANKLAENLVKEAQSA